MTNTTTELRFVNVHEDDVALSALCQAIQDLAYSGRQAGGIDRYISTFRRDILAACSDDSKGYALVHFFSQLSDNTPSLCSNLGVLNNARVAQVREALCLAKTDSMYKAIEDSLRSDVHRSMDYRIQTLLLFAVEAYHSEHTDDDDMSCIKADMYSLTPDRDQVSKILKQNQDPETLKLLTGSQAIRHVNDELDKFFGYVYSDVAKFVVYYLGT